MQLDVEDTARMPRRPSKYLAPRRVGVLALATVVASLVVSLLVVASPGRATAARVNFSPARSTSRIPAAPAQGTASLDTPSADVFMQAVIAHNGQLAWQQLCPELQAKVPAPALVDMVNSGNSTSQGEQFQVDAVGTHAWSGGGAIHVYVVTAHWPPDKDAHMLFILRTQASGCIDGILSA